MPFARGLAITADSEGPVPEEVIERQDETKLRAALARTVEGQRAVVVEQSRLDERARLKRTRVDRLQAELLQVRRQVKAAQQKERHKQEQLQAMALDDSLAAELWGATDRPGGEGEAKSAPRPPALEGAAGRNAVCRQSKQLRWRCQELKALEDKVAALREHTSELNALS